MIKKNKITILAGILAISTVLAGCTRSINSIAPTAPPRALPSNPAEPVSANQLPPINSGQQPPVDQSGTNMPIDGQNPQNLDGDNVAINMTPPPNAPKLTRESLAGSWQVPTDGLDCRIILAFTKWSGGYRAATRRCTSPEIQTINAWDVKDQSVILVDQSGNEVARLFASQSGRYDGRTKSGAPVSFVR